MFGRAQTPLKLALALSPLAKQFFRSFYFLLKLKHFFKRDIR
jgi:hypothetical protein